MEFINTNTTYRLKGEKAENRGNFRSRVKVDSRQETLITQ